MVQNPFVSTYGDAVFRLLTVSSLLTFAIPPTPRCCIGQERPQGAVGLGQSCPNAPAVLLKSVIAGSALATFGKQWGPRELGPIRQGELAPKSCKMSLSEPLPALFHIRH